MIEFSQTENIVFFSGELKTPFIKSAWERINRLLKESEHSTLIFELSNVTAIDSAGVALLDELKYSSEKKIQFLNTPFKIQQAIDSFSSDKELYHQPLRKLIFFEIVGEKAVLLWNNFIRLLYLTADIFYWSFIGLIQRKGQRKGSYIQQSILIGVNAFQIVALISFLIGLILALQSAAQLRQFGANIYVAELIGVAMVREMGLIMTAIVIAGRSGSSIA